MKARTDPLAPIRRWSTRLLSSAWLALVVPVVLLASCQGTDSIDPYTVELPQTKADIGAPLTDYFEGEGGAIISYVNAAAPLIDESTAERCAGVVEELNRLGGPRELADLASRAPDPATTDMALASIAATTEYLTECVKGSDELPDAFEFHLVVLWRQIAEMQR